MTRDREPCAPGRKEPLRGLPAGLAARLGGQAGSGEGAAPAGKTELVFEAEGLKGGCVCPSRPPGGWGRESSVAGERQPSCPGQGGAVPTRV